VFLKTGGKIDTPIFSPDKFIEVSIFGGSNPQHEPASIFRRRSANGVKKMLGLR
jgi:hypothetical protein